MLKCQRSYEALPIECGARTRIRRRTVMTRLGEGEFVYEVAHDWGEQPDGWTLGDVAAVAVDRTDRVYVFHRGTHPLIVFERDGRFLCSWGGTTYSISRTG